MANEKAANRLLSPLAQNNLILLCIAFLLAAFIGLVESMTSIFVLLAATVLVTYLLLGPVNLVERVLSCISRKGKSLLPLGVRRPLAILLVYLLLAGCIFIIAWRVMPPLFLQAQSFAHDIPQYLNRLQTVSTSTSPVQTQQQLLSMTITHVMHKLTILYGQYASKLGGYLLDLGTSALSGLIYTLTMLVLVFILLHDGPQLKNGFIELMPDRFEKRVEAFLNRFHQHADQFIKAQAMMSLLSGSMIYLMFTLLGSKYALLLGVFYGFVSIVPVVGPLVGLIALVSFVAFGEAPEYIAPVVLYVVTFYLLKTYWLWPKMLPKRSDIHPVIFLVVLLGCLQVAGLFGVLLSFPLASVLGVLLDYLRESSAKA